MGTPEITGKLPGYLSPSTGLKFEDIPNGLGAVSKVPAAGWLQIIAYFGFCEFSGGFEDYKTGTPGDYGWKVLTSDDPAEKTKKLSAEIANGRLAMVASSECSSRMDSPAPPGATGHSTPTHPSAEQKRR